MTVYRSIWVKIVILSRQEHFQLYLERAILLLKLNFKGVTLIGIYLLSDCFGGVLSGES